jgi:hypothetical protein
MSKFLELAKQAGLHTINDDGVAATQIEKFGALVAKHSAEIANYMEDTDQDEIGPAILAYFGLKNV